MNDFERAIWGFRKTDRYAVDSGKESSSLLGYAEESLQSSNKAPSQPIIFQPPQTIGRRVDPEKKQEEKQEKKEKQVENQKQKNDWENIRLAIANEESIEDEWESMEQQAESGNDREEHEFFSGEESEESEVNEVTNSPESSDGFLKAFMRDNKSVYNELNNEDSVEDSESTRQEYEFPVIDWIEAALERRKSDDRESLGSFPYSCPDIPCEKLPERKAQSFKPGGTIRKPRHSIAKLPVCLASVDVQLDLNRPLDLPFPVSQLNHVEWELTAVKGKVVLPAHTVFMELILTAAIEVVSDDRLQLIKVDVPIEKTFQVDWKEEPILPYSKSCEYMFLCPKSNQISTHRVSYQKLAEEVQLYIPDFRIVSYEELKAKQEVTVLTVTGHLEAKLDLSQSQYVTVMNI